MNPLQMTPEEEVSVILDDIFDGDEEAQTACLRDLAEANGLVYEDLSQEELNDLIIENEDELYSISNINNIIQ